MKKIENMLNFAATSDLHGHLPDNMKPFDLLMICGDVIPLNSSHYYGQEGFFKGKFMDWIKSLPYKTPWSKVIYVPGNHDSYFEYSSGSKKKEIENLSDGRLKILIHELYEWEYPVSDGVDSLTIFGTPYCSIFGNWSFMINDDALDKKFDQIPYSTEILLSHDSPNIHGLGDITQGPFRQTGTGNHVLAKHIDGIRPLILHCGHFHSGRHEFQQHGDIWMANVSYVDETYKPAYPVLTYRFDEETKTVLGNED